MKTLSALLQRASVTLLATGGRYLVWFHLMSVALMAAPAGAQAPWTGAPSGSVTVPLWSRPPSMILAASNSFMSSRMKISICFAHSGTSRAVVWRSIAWA